MQARPVELTAVQRRALERLVRAGSRTAPPDLAARLRARIERGLEGLELPEPLFLGKAALNDRDRCEGTFASRLAGEGPPFAHSRTTALGALLHRAIEVDVGARDEHDPHAVCLRSAERLLEDDPAFASYWRELDRLEQDELLAEAVRRLALFRGTFPPLRELRRELAPVSELPVRVELAGGALVLSGRIDLVLGRPEPGRATRVAIDLKSGGAYPEYPEDMRFYALLLTLRFGVPPARVATVFLESGEWQAEDVGDLVLEHAADRVVAAARTAASLAAGAPPALRPGPYCGWCPRAAGCPALARDGSA
ncbi:MAG TPA: PD-(D/E)XK nuclease family protein [Actinomycetota bacterium]|nr:PD-(D/E)XK nuclease family protein [Actinomycetota bacterium]